MKKRVLSVLLCLVLILCTGCSILDAAASSPKTFSKSGLSIELTTAFQEKEHVSFTAYYLSSDTMVTALLEEYNLFEGYGINSLEDYAALVMQANGLDGEPEYKNGLLCFFYDAEVNGKDFSYMAVVYEGEDGFWLLNFASESKNFDNLLPTFITYAKSVKV